MSAPSHTANSNSSAGTVTVETSSAQHGITNPFRHPTPTCTTDSNPTSTTPTLDISEERIPTHPSPPLWTHRLSASFSAVAEQIAAASQALAQVPLTAPIHPPGNLSGVEGVDSDLDTLRARITAIEHEQERLGAELDAVRADFANVANQDSHVQEVSSSGLTIDDLGNSLKELVDTVKLDQTRLYTRLLNASATASKMSIRAVPVAGGGTKAPPNFPATKGEFEHLTKERYESILKAYGISAKGDIVAKRETLRAFLGLPA